MPCQATQSRPQALNSSAEESRTVRCQAAEGASQDASQEGGCRVQAATHSGPCPSQHKACCTRHHTAQQLDNNGKEDGQQWQGAWRNAAACT